MGITISRLVMYICTASIAIFSWHPALANTDFLYCRDDYSVLM